MYGVNSNIAKELCEKQPRFSAGGHEWSVQKLEPSKSTLGYWLGSEGYVFKIVDERGNAALLKLLNDKSAIQLEKELRWQRLQWLCEFNDDCRSKGMPSMLRALPSIMVQDTFGISQDNLWGYIMASVPGRTWKGLKENQRTQNISTADRVDLVRQLATAIAWLEARMMAHCDLADTNIVIDLSPKPPALYLVDYDLFYCAEMPNLSVHSDDGRFGHDGYIAPEKTNLIGYGYDRFALGLLCYEFLAWSFWGEEGTWLVAQETINDGELNFNMDLVPEEIRTNIGVLFMHVAKRKKASDRPAPIHWLTEIGKLLPKEPPPAAEKVTVSLAGESIKINISPVPGLKDASYAVVRREGKNPPFTIEDGELVVEKTPQTILMDVNIEPGRSYSYSVFTYHKDTYSMDGCPSKCIRVAPDIHPDGLKLTESDQEVIITVQSPPRNVSQLEIARKTLTKRINKDEAFSETGLENDHAYTYLVRCIYQLPDGSELKSKGIRVHATPALLPTPILSLEVEICSGVVRGRFDPPDKGRAVIIRSAKDPGIPVGSSIKESDIRNLGRIISAADNTFVDSQPTAKEPFYAVFTISSSHAVAGPVRKCAFVPDVTNLRLKSSVGIIELKWEWPADCESVVIVRKVNEWPAGREDKGADYSRLYSLALYSKHGKYDDQHGNSEEYYYVVYSKIAEEYAPGLSEGCRGKGRALSHLPYSVRFTKRGQLRIEWDLPKFLTSFGGFVIVGNKLRIPQHLKDGYEIMKLVPPNVKDFHHGKKHKKTDLPSFLYPSFYQHMFLLREEDSEFIKITDMVNVQPVVWKGSWHKPTSGGLKMWLKWSLPPRHILCPHEFRTFPTWELRFRDRDGKLHSQRNKWLRRGTYLLWPPRRLKLPKGEVCTKKVCPLCEGDLPDTSGIQKDIVIGLIGAKGSAKSHYVATLVNRLQNEVGIDFSASLRGLNQQTLKTYTEHYYDPLFKNHMELRATQEGISPPLIYSLRIGGELWGKPKQSRSVTLVLCDTAGENFTIEKWDLAQRTPYLNVVKSLIFLVDPLQWEAVRQQVGSNVILPDIVMDPTTILQEVSTEFLSRGLARDGRVRTPVALTLTKFDAVRHLISPDSIWHENIHHSKGRYDLGLHQAIDSEISRHVQQWGGQNYITHLSLYKDHAFFAVSCTGCSSDKNSRFERVEPWRVEEPLLWLLHKLGMISEG